MILGVEHISMSCAHLSSASSVFKSLGYEVKFKDDRLPNHPAKTPFLKTYKALHGIAYCQARERTSIELTCHDQSLREDQAALQVLFSRAPYALKEASQFTGGHWGEIWEAAGVCQKIRRGFWEPFNSLLWYEEKKGGEARNDFSATAVLIPCSDYSLSIDFFVKGLGCRKDSSGEFVGNIPWTRLQFRSVVPSWNLVVVLAQLNDRERPPDSRLDDAGFPCLALITNDIESDKRALVEMGARDMTETFQLFVNLRRLKVSIFREPSGQLIELIEFDQKGG